VSFSERARGEVSPSERAGELELVSNERYERSELSIFSRSQARPPSPVPRKEFSLAQALAQK
tara:strand:+ start:163 stop:348 length:186 start_codon:yes stop_codon:yes gene_type:complete